MGKAFKACILIFTLVCLNTFAAAADSLSNSPKETTPTTVMTTVNEPVRLTPDFKLINDRPLIIREYGFGILGSIVTGTLGFFIGSGIETAISGEEDSHKGTLGFTGIRYDNQYGAFWGGATGLLMGSAFTTYFIGETDEEEGSLLPTLLGTAVATGGALALASWMGVNDDINWTPFIPLLAVPSIGGTLGFNLSRLYNDHKREKMVGNGSATSSLQFHSPSFGFSPVAGGGERLVVRALHLTF